MSSIRFAEHAMVPVVTYEPRMSAEEAERLRRWHERAYADSREEGDSGQTFEYLGLILDVPADVMPISRVSVFSARRSSTR